MGNEKKVVLCGMPQERQKLFFESRAKYTAYGGARGGGKSWALRRKIALMCLRYPGLSVLLLRRTLPELRENHIRPMLSELSGLVNYNDTRKCMDFPGGSHIQFGYCDSEGDVDRYQGQEYDVIAIDEATQFSEYQFQTLKACLRGANSFPKRMYLTCNPGGVGHGWVKRLFIDREYRGTEDPSEYEFIPARVYDNKILLSSDPDYVKQLESLPKELREAWLCGSWNVFAGQFFPEFSEEIHVCEPRPLPEEWMRVCALDYGLDMLAAVFAAVSPEGEAYVYDEVHESGLIVSEAAKRLSAKLCPGMRVLAPGDLWSRQKDSGKSIAELFGENGIWFSKVGGDRVSGWLCLKEWLKPYEDEDGNRTAKLRIFASCRNLIRCLPLLLHASDGSGDASTEPHAVTHITDALRYFAVGVPMRKSSVPAPLPAREKLVKKLLHRHGGSSVQRPWA